MAILLGISRQPCDTPLRMGSREMFGMSRLPPEDSVVREESRQEGERRRVDDELTNSGPWVAIRAVSKVLSQLVVEECASPMTIKRWRVAR